MHSKFNLIIGSSSGFISFYVKYEISVSRFIVKYSHDSNEISSTLYDRKVLKMKRFWRESLKGIGISNCQSIRFSALTILFGIDFVSCFF